jgi:proline/betaine transport protein TphA
MKAKGKNSIISPLFGNALEWYDFLIYASFAPIFAQIFFPSSSYFISLVETFSVFAMGFIMRPIGGVIIGHYADHHGRRTALIISMCIMTFSTWCIGLLPDAQSIGIAAPILFSLLRMLQGLAIGGELPGSTTYLIEQYWGSRRGLSGSLILSSAFIGILLGSLATTLFSALFTGDALIHWGWRFPYYIGGLLGIWGIYLRLKSTESPIFLEEKEKPMPINTLWKRYKKEMYFSITITSVLALGNYLLIAYVTTFLVRSEGFSLHEALTINLIALFVLSVFIPIMGFISDLMDRKKLFIIGLMLLILVILPFFYYIANKNWWAILWVELVLALVMAPINATVPTMIAEFFPANIRGRGISLSYNIGQALFGGTVPLIALGLTHYTGNKLAPGYYILFWALVVLVLVSWTGFRKETQE